MKKYYLILLSLIMYSAAFSQIIKTDTVYPKYAAYYVGSVVDSTGHPVLFATITVEGLETTYNDPTGRFILQFPESFFSDSLTIQPIIKFSNPYYEEYTEQIMISKGDSITGPPVILRLRTTDVVKVSGRVSCGENKYKYEAIVTFYGVNNSTWYNIFLNPPGDYSIQIARDSYYVQCWVNYNTEFFRTSRIKYFNDKPDISKADILILDKDTSGIDFTFPDLKIGSISGKVRDAVTQQPLGGCFILVSSAQPGDSTGIGTGPEGTYSIQVFEGDYILLADKMGYHRQFYKDATNTFGATPITVGSNNLNVTGIDFNLTTSDPGTNTISGFIKEQITYKPLSNVMVYAVPLAGGNWIETISDPNGRYSILDIKNGKYILIFNKEGYTSEYYNNAFQWEDSNIFDFTGNQNINADDVFLIPMNPFGGEISGKISSNSGNALSGTLISAVNNQGKIVATSFSAHNGNYIIPSLINGEYTIKASKIGYKTCEYSSKVNMDLVSNAIVGGVDFSIIISSVNKSGNEIPESFELYQNYPNPFNPSTAIGYQLSAFSHITLKVYDILGHEVAVLVNEEKPAGTYNVEWNAKGISSGVYFYQLRALPRYSRQAENFVITKKLLLLK